jgi:flagellar biosynthesis GTPase FlhF
MREAAQAEVGQVAAREAELQRLADAYQRAQAHREQSSAREDELKSKLESLREAAQAEEIQIATQEEELKHLQEQYIQSQTDAEQRASRERELKTEISRLQTAATETANSDLANVAAPVASDQSDIVGVSDDPWLTIDLHHSKAPAAKNGGTGFVPAPTTADLVSSEQIFDLPPVGRGNEIQLYGSGLSDEIMARLQSSDSSNRAAALVDLAEAGGEESFTMITKSFDDPSVEVRNAAARALYSLNPEMANTFTRALREASPERRRKIGSAIAASGLAANAINSLSGEGRDRTYDAFSILFLMAKAGEVQPLMQAIAKHQNNEVRLTAVKLLALSNQHHVLPGLRNMAARDPLPPDVHTAVMEAIYLLSNQSREVA